MIRHKPFWLLLTKWSYTAWFFMVWLLCVRSFEFTTGAKDKMSCNTPYYFRQYFRHPHRNIFYMGTQIRIQNSTKSYAKLYIHILKIPIVFNNQLNYKRNMRDVHKIINLSANYQYFKVFLNHCKFTKYCHMTIPGYHWLHENSSRLFNRIYMI